MKTYPGYYVENITDVSRVKLMKLFEVFILINLSYHGCLIAFKIKLQW